jgi:hypothetical protein
MDTFEAENFSSGDITNFSDYGIGNFAVFVVKGTQIALFKLSIIFFAVCLTN